MIPWLGMENDIFVEKTRGTQKQKRLPVHYANGGKVQ
jgi:hypothetical protein